MAQTKLAERRDSVRAPGSYAVAVRDARGRLIGRGRTANLSQNGVLVLLPCARPPLADHLVQLDMDLPWSPGDPRRIRTVRYRARVVRVEPMGRWHGIAFELQDKLQ